MSRFSYVEATAQFERALAELAPTSMSGQRAEDETRLYEKIGRSLLYTARPDFATTWFERAVEKCATLANRRSKLIELLQLLPTQRWLESRTKDALGVRLAPGEHSNEVEMRFSLAGAPPLSSVMSQHDQVIANILTLDIKVLLGHSGRPPAGSRIR